MCLRFQFCTHQRVCILHFPKKSNSLYPKSPASTQLPRTKRTTGRWKTLGQRPADASLTENETSAEIEKIRRRLSSHSSRIVWGWTQSKTQFGKSSLLSKIQLHTQSQAGFQDTARVNSKKPQLEVKSHQKLVHRCHVAEDSELSKAHLEAMKARCHLQDAWQTD
jgi:hypothetical protein